MSERDKAAIIVDSILEKNQSEKVENLALLFPLSSSKSVSSLPLVRGQVLMNEPPWWWQEMQGLHGGNIESKRTSYLVLYGKVYGKLRCGVAWKLANRPPHFKSSKMAARWRRYRQKQ